MSFKRHVPAGEDKILPFKLSSVFLPMLSSRISLMYVSISCLYSRSTNLFVDSGKSIGSWKSLAMHLKETGLRNFKFSTTKKLKNYPY